MSNTKKSLNVAIYNGLSNWNDNAESSTGERILTEEQVGTFSDQMYEYLIDLMVEEEVYDELH